MKKLVVLLLCFNAIAVYGQCLHDVIILPGYLITPLTQSDSWIITIDNEVTIADENNIIQLDADPVNGFVELNPGFIAFPLERGAFIAQTLDGCQNDAPARFNSESNNTLLNSDNIKIFPNPTKNVFYVDNQNMDDGTIEVYNILGVKILQQTFISNSTVELNLENQPSQMFLVKIISDGYVISKRILKE